MGTRKKGKVVEDLRICALVFAAAISICKGAAVTEVTPRTGSTGGGVRLTISGSGFSADQFSMNDDPNTGNFVYLISESGSEYTCQILRDGCTEGLITCYTPYGMPEEKHYVKVVVDGTTVPDSQLCGGNPTSSKCTYEPKNKNSPTITSINHQSGMPGENIIIEGKIFSDRYGSNMATATNGRTEKILRVIAGPRECELKDNDEFYGLALNDENSNYGSMECKTQGTSVGFYNISYILESPLGRSVADGDLYRVSYNDQIYLYQTYTDISSISQSVGSEAGGLQLTIYGDYFDDGLPYALVRAYVGDTICDVVDVIPDVSVECVVAADPQYTASKFEGNRGVNFEYWTSTSKDRSSLDSILSLTNTDPGYNSTILDETSFYDVNGMDDYVSKMTTYFQPPHSGEYAFFLKADDGARLFIDGVEVVTSVRSWEGTARKNLDKNTRYLLEVVHYENGGDSYIYLKAMHYDTAFTNSWTSKAVQETQTIGIKSIITYDVQELEFSQFTGQSSVSEVQILTLYESGQFRLGMYNVYTEPLTIDMDDASIQDALKKLPIWGSEESVLVVRNPTDPPSYTLTFESKRGDFPDIQVKAVSGSSVRYDVSQDTRGVPDLDTIALSIGNVVSEPFSVSSLDASTIASVIDGMFSSRCPKVFEGKGTAAHYESFEGKSSQFVGGTVKNTEAFCGTHVLKNPYRIYKKPDDENGIMLSQYGTLCFAYRGFLRDIIGVRYSYRDATDLEIYSSNHQFYHSYQTDSTEESTTWYYTCVDVYDVVFALRPSDMELRLDEVWAYRASGSVDAYIDSVYIGSKATTDDPEAHKRRLPSAQPNGIVVERADVTELSSNVYEVTLRPYDCGNGFPLFELANGRQSNSLSGTSTLSSSTSSTSSTENVTESTTSNPNMTATFPTFTGNVTESTTSNPNMTATFPTSTGNVTESTTSNPNTTATFPTFSGNVTESTTSSSTLSESVPTSSVTSGRTRSTSNSATLTLNNGKGTVTVTRTSEASPPVGGLIDVEFNGNEGKGLNVSLTDAAFGRELMSIKDIGAVSVWKNGDCSSFDLVTTFISRAGDLPEMKVDFSGLTGRGPYGTIATNLNGGLYYDPLTGDMLSTVHDSPQVRLYINDVPTSCSGDCSFQWDSSVTPTITSVTPTSGTKSSGTSIDISGTTFSSVLSENTVVIGGVDCAVTAATSTSITCSVGNGPVGAYPILVNVDGKGFAEGNVEFTYTTAISSISPISGSLGGGVKLTVSGNGFATSSAVTINSKTCRIISVQADEIICNVPSSTVSGQFDVQVEPGSLSYSGFTYDNSLTASVSSVVPSIITSIGENLTISGSSFTSSRRSVFVGIEEAVVLSWSDSEIEISIGEIDSGLQDIKIEGANGFAVDSTNFNLPTVNVDLRITNVYPLQGSILGGTRLTITGTGFDRNASNVQVDIGSVGCTIESITHTKIICVIEAAGTTHYVTNNGVDRAFGVYYAFDEPHITINEGDYVQWSWETPAFVNDIAHAIIEVESPSFDTAKAGGFSSGTPSRNGNFRHQFVRAGLYYVWSGYVDIYAIKNYYGTIEVVSGSSSSGEISVRVGKATAIHDIGGDSDPVDRSACKSSVSGKSSCVDSQASVNDNSKFNFAFWTCSTPVVNDVEVNNGTTQTDIIITGEGFSTTECQNEVTFGGYNCIVNTAFEDELVCNLENAGEPELGILHQIDLRVHNRGQALINILDAVDRGFGVIPNIENITPMSGSLAGGARLTISGFGFGDNPLATIDGYECTIIESSYSEIICESPSHVYQGEKEVKVFAYIDGAPLEAVCETLTQTCVYSYAMLWTPSVSNITPSSMSGRTTFTITGSSLGNNIAELEVTFNDVIAVVDAATDTQIEVTVDNLPAGNNDVFVRVKDYGKASGALTVSSLLAVDSITPSSGSIHGDTDIIIRGNGFITNDTTVEIDGTPCDIFSTSLSEISCTTRAHASGTESVAITTNGISDSSASFNFDLGSTPTVTSINPTSGSAGDTLTISGSNLNGGAVVILIGLSGCVFDSGSNTEVTCIIGNHSTGLVPVYVHVEGLGAANNDIEFEYELSISSINPTRGGSAGGQVVVISGTGFDDTASATICGNECTPTSVTSSTFTCKTPANSDQTCDVEMSLNGLTKTLSSAYTYDSALTPSITGVSPARGGTGGGTTLTISGSGFGTTLGDASVEINGTACVVSDVIDTKIECVTGPHTGSIETKVEVQIAGNGIAEENTPGDADFEYIDVWSSTFTWGGGPLPQEGEFVVIPAGMTLLLDTDTPVLAFLLIQGRLIFDEQDIELQSNIIMITDGGLLQVGTEDKPFKQKAIITLHGHHRSKELPIYGTKVLAVRNGTLDLHGITVPITWTRLAATAAKGSTTLQLKDPVHWNIGDEIAIASTGHRQTQRENEKKTIVDISADNMTLTLDSALEAEHVGVEERFDGTLVEMRAEVGLLTHNVVVRGNQDVQWQDEIKACEAGFNVGEFATQTCFQGRFGDEIGSSQFGAMILVHAPVYNTHEAKARISYTEVTFAGQAFRLGRYPIHFHLNGDMSTSYVRGCGIHKTFNRAVNIHGTHNTTVEKTVIYDIMGGAFFLEDGIETGNTLQYNLAIFVIGSSSLLNDDVTPASYWVTNPDNIIQHNAAAGGTHFGYWYRMHNHPDGPSFTKTVCPVSVPLGVFRNNSAHSFGWFGLWIFESYFPRKDGCGGSEVEPAVFESLFAWNNEKGAESVNTGAVQFVNFVLVQNKFSGVELKKTMDVPLYTDDSPMVKDSLVVAKTQTIPNSHQGCTTSGIVFPMGKGFRLVNVRFVSFNEASCYAFGTASIAGTCSVNCGGFTYHTEALKFVDSPRKMHFGWEWEAIILDKDGTITGKAGNWTILPTSGTVPTDCEDASEFSFGLPGSMCPPQYKWHRFSFNEIVPAAIEGKDFIFTNNYGNSSVPFLKKRITHPMGWMCAFLSGSTFIYHFENAAQIRNISFKGRFDDFGVDDYIYLRFKVHEVPDRFTIDGGNTFINATVGGIDPTTAKNGDWEWDNANDEVKFIVHGRQRSRRSLGVSSVVNNAFTFSTYKCFYDNCIPPADPRTIPPATDRPLSFEFWHDTSIWNITDDGFMANVGANGTRLPEDFEDVRILAGTWVIVNGTSVNRFGTLLVEGVLEFADYENAVYNIEADFIVIKGGRLIIGWPDDPFDGLATITLRGNHSSPYLDPGTGSTLGSKAIGVFGGLDLFGKDVGLTWTQLAASANAGSNEIVLSDQVGWTVGDDIVIGPTGYDPWQTESFKITNVAADNVTLTLNDTLRFKHTVHNETLSNGQDISVGAAVGLLSHNIKIIGEDYNKLYKESYGARVLVGLISDKGETYAGYARVSNVEFYHTGQEGFTEEYDPRFSLSYVAVGTVNDIRPSTVRKCSFHNGFNTAIGAFGIGSLEIEDNVVFGTVGNGIHTSSSNNSLVHNLVALMMSTASYQDRVEPFNFRWEAGIEAIDATALTLQDNLVTGSERIAFHVPTQECDDTSNSYRNNRMYSNVNGVMVLPGESKPQGCAKLSNFIAWKSLDFGMYYQDSTNFVSEDNLFIENGNGLLALITGPGALSHVYADKRVFVKNSTFVGQTSSFDCTTDVTPSGDDNIELSANSRPSRPPKVGGKSGMVGVVFPNYNSGSNNAPKKPFKGLMNYNAIGGLTTLTDVTFAKYGETSCKHNYAITTNQANDDGQHPVNTERTTLIDVDHDHKTIFHRPNVGKINSADCVDMDCDAMKKAMIKDLDGSFLGHIGTVLPHSEYEWNRDPRRGLGDYRIPKEMVTELDGTRIPYDVIAPNKGIIGNKNCTYQASWQAYECFDDINYEMLIIESMDSDTETRRLSPVAILGDGYIDLINGPQDHGWCSGYTCRKRISTFMAIVATDKDYLMHFTSTTPEHMRYRLLNVDPNEGIVLTVWYSRPNRLDVFVNGEFKIATNARIDSQGRYIITMPRGNEYKPQIANGTGTNYYDRDRGEISFVIQGSDTIDVISQSTIIVSFGLPALEVSDFYGENLIENLAAFLNIPLTKVRVMSVTSEAGTGRRKRSTTGVYVVVEIGDGPKSAVNITVSDTIDYEALIQLVSEIVNECQVGNISQTLNITGTCETVELPSTDPSVASIVYNTPSPDHLYFDTKPKVEYEGVPLKDQPKIRAADIANNVVTILGTAEYPWQMTVSVRDGTGHPSNMLNGTLTVNCSDGWFNFTDLTITHMGLGYILDFNITYPLEAENFTLASDPLDVPGRPLKAHVVQKTSGDILRDGQFSVTLDLRDSNTEEIITDIQWRQHSWTAEVSMIGNSPYASLAGTTLASFDTVTGRVMFPDLSMTGFGIFYLQFRVVSNPPDFDFTLNHKVPIKNPAHVAMVIEETSEVKVKFDDDFNEVLPTEDKQNEFEQMILTYFANIWPDVQLSVGSIYEGSIVVTFVLSGSYSDVNTTAYSLCDDIYNGTAFDYNGYSLTLSPFMTINNDTYYGVVCGDLSGDEEDDGMAVYLIVIIVLLCVLVLAAIIGIVVWRCNVKPKTQTHDWRAGTLYNGEQKPDQYLFRDDTFASMGFNSGRAPAATGIHSVDEKRPLSGFSVSVKDPVPEPINVTKLKSTLSDDGLLTPPPVYYSPGPPTYVEPNGSNRGSPVNQLRSPSPSTSVRSHSPFEPSSSPLPPVGSELYHSDYITTRVPGTATPHLPAPSPLPSPHPSPNGSPHPSPQPIPRFNRKPKPKPSNGKGWLY